MKLLLDTHVLIWAALSPERLSEQASQLFLDRANELWFSYASIWEMQIKLSLGKLDLQVPLPQLVEAQQKANDIRLLAIDLSHLYRLNDLPSHHRDPFDRLIIAQALVEDLPILSVDAAFDSYPIQRLWQ